MKQKHSLFLLLAIVAVVAAIWSFMLLSAPRQLTLDQRAHAVGEQLKCPICQGESVADSPSGLAQQMRGIIRQQLQEGKSEQEIIQYFRNSYGDQIVWSPPWQGVTLLAWLAPIALLLGGVVLLFLTLREWRLTSPSASGQIAADEETKALAQIDDEALERYQVLLAEELAADDALFEKYRTEAK
ncbi:MAG TPA: cytochrome c-type biogenesis protein [Ktedonosporobacter sp.]|nr:cytochrome c-type biogenesis protein [Ktedonosporobacter sp.]